MILYLVLHVHGHYGPTIIGIEDDISTAVLMANKWAFPEDSIMVIPVEIGQTIGFENLPHWFRKKGEWTWNEM